VNNLYQKGKQNAFPKKWNENYDSEQDGNIYPEWQYHDRNKYDYGP